MGTALAHQERHVTVSLDPASGSTIGNGTVRTATFDPFPGNACGGTPTVTWTLKPPIASSGSLSVSTLTCTIGIGTWTAEAEYSGGTVGKKVGVTFSFVQQHGANTHEGKTRARYTVGP